MKQIVVSALIAALVSGLLVLLISGRPADEPPGEAVAPDPAAAGAATTSGQPSPLQLSVTDALPEDVWVDGSRQPGDDHRILTSTENSVCFITKVQISGVGSADDTSACTMQVDEFTGFWDLVVSVPEGSQSAVRCNARCLTWE
jgi:hypothetical protein